MTVQRVGAERVELFAEHVRRAEVRRRIRLHRRADVVALAVRDDEHALFAGIGDRLRERLHALPAVHLIVRGLRLYGRDNIAQRVDEALVVFEQCGGRSLQRFAILCDGASRM